MRIARAALAAILFLSAAAASAATIELQSGDKLEGEILEETDTTVVLQHPVLGRLEIAKSEIKPPEKEKVPDGLFGTQILRGWKKSLSAGFNGSTGKAEQTQANADLNLSRKLERHRMAFTTVYVYARSDGQTADHNVNMRYVHDFLIPDASWFPFATANYRYDTQQDWRHRLGAQAGLGYDFLKSEEWEVTGRVGAGVSQTFEDARDEQNNPTPPPNRIPQNDPNPERTEPNALLALQVVWNYTEGQSLTAATLYLPDLADTPEYRSENMAEWKVAVGFVDGLGFKTGINFIYDTHEIGGNRRDLRYYANIVYDF